jgi:hypothetical protein
LRVKAHLAATAVAVAVNPIQLAPALTAWLAVAAVVLAVMVVAEAVDLAAATVVAVVAEAVAVVVATAVATAVVTAAVAVAARSVADQRFISNSLACDRQWPDHRTSCRGCAVHGAWSPCPAFWRATF